MEKTTITLVCDLLKAKDAEIPVKRTLINMGLIKDAHRIPEPGAIVYTVRCTPEQAAEIQKLHP